MKRTLALGLLLAAPLAAVPQDDKSTWDRRMKEAAKSQDAWTARRAEIRRQILVSAGLWPEFERPPLKPVVFHRLERDGYTVEKVHIETLPGFHLTGNLYRPLGKKGPFPGVVSPHGHWKVGRFNDTKDGSIPGRSITLARLGFVVFTYDMVGYGDFKQLPHRFSDPAWGMGLLGLQLWNSLRAVDFVESLPDVDPKRIGATGASGGGTQTFMLTAVDDRIACSAPVNMVAAEFQGGCSCENAPFLRIGLNNVEIAACMAPRPLILVSCTGDWTKHSLELEGPAVRRAYKALGFEERFRVVRFDYGHNYNQDSREAVYAWFVRWLQGGPDAMKIPEPAFTVEKKEDLAVFGPDHPLPEGAVDAEGLKKLLREKVKAQLESLRPKDAASLARFRKVMIPLLKIVLTNEGSDVAGITRHTRADRITTQVLTDDHRASLALGHDREEPPSGGNKDQLKKYPTTFFRTRLARWVQELTDDQAVCERSDIGETRMVGRGDAGPATLLAAALSPSKKLKTVIVDMGGLDDAAEETWTGRWRDHPSMLRAGGLRTAAILCAPRRLVLHNTQGRFDASWARDAYRAAGAEDALTVSEAAWTEEQIREALK